MLAMKGYRGVGGGMRGADIAFYQNRARYHTSEDSIRAMGREGTLRALWAMMEVARGAGSALLGASENALGEDVVGNAEPSTYFERRLRTLSKVLNSDGLMCLRTSIRGLPHRLPTTRTDGDLHRASGCGTHRSAHLGLLHVSPNAQARRERTVDNKL